MDVLSSAMLSTNSVSELRNLQSTEEHGLEAALSTIHADVHSNEHSSMRPGLVSRRGT